MPDEVPTESAMRRLLLVGCSRSGTTILQKELARRLNLYTLPETGFLLGRLANPKIRASKLEGLRRIADRHPARPDRGYLAKSLALFQYWLPHIGPIRLATALFSAGGAAREWTRWLDQRAIETGRAGWIEKTPLHFYHLDLLQIAEPPVPVVFVVRDGKAVVASIVDRARRFPDNFGRQGIDYAIALWNDSVRIAARESVESDVICVRYEDFVAAPDALIAGIGGRCAAVPAGEYAQFSPDIVRNLCESFEVWQDGANGPVSRPQDKWSRIFTPEERHHIEGALDFGSYRRIRFLNIPPKCKVGL